ncbi:alternate-type signal peptide domain-containing protein [Nocardioides rubriscoriae]|uniref:alternate-type signal peptide domain-containing protein n=1 Tax=Nocardioides rubriscoriae TaxID=642762 RepID=UPI0011DF3994|nr:alternate-type signal peptide domain-containing protein [Nocardioides rubriscoriae]
MNKTTKGAFAASAAAVLLLGGAGSLAYWTDNAFVDGGSITAGTLDIAAGTCDTDWTYAGSKVGTGKVTLFVPGDVVTKKCTFTIAATGDNLKASVAAPSSLDVTGSKTGSSLSISTAASYTLTKGTASKTIANGGTITSADDASTLTATFVATIPFGTDETAGTKVNANDTQAITATLNRLTVSLTQLNPNA